MNLQDIVTDALGADAVEETASLWEEMHEDHGAREVLLLGEEALREEVGSSAWRHALTRFAIGRMYYRTAFGYSQGACLLVRLLDFDEDPERLPQLQENLEATVRAVSLEVHTSSADEALSFIRDVWGEEDAAQIAARASGVKTPTAQRWIDMVTEPARTKSRRLYNLVRSFYQLQPLLGRDGAQKWLEEPLPGGEAPIDIIASGRYDSVPWEVSHAITQLSVKAPVT